MEANHPTLVPVQGTASEVKFVSKTYAKYISKHQLNSYVEATGSRIVLPLLQYFVEFCAGQMPSLGFVLTPLQKKICIVTIYE